MKDNYEALKTLKYHHFRHFIIYLILCIQNYCKFTIPYLQSIRNLKHNFLLRKIFCGNLNETISLAEIEVIFLKVTITQKESCIESNFARTF